MFAVRRGILANRFDVKNVLYQTVNHSTNLLKATLGSLTSEEPCYGTSATAVTRTDENQPKYIRITDFNDFGIEANHKYVTTESYSEKHVLKPGDILFARTGATVGKTYYYDGSIGKAVFAGYCIRFRFDEKKVFPKYVYWYTKTTAFLNWVNGIQRPSGQPNINKEEYKSFEIILPDYETQKQLSDKLDIALKQRNSMLEHTNELLTNQSNILLQYLNIVIDRFGSSLCSVVSLQDLKKDKTFNADYYHPERLTAINSMKNNSLFCLSRLIDVVDFCRSIVNSSDANERYLGLSGVESQTGELTGIKEDVSGQAFTYQSNDVLYGRLRPYLNKVHFAEQSGICSTEFHVMRVKNQKDLLPEYLAEIMRSDLILSQTKHMMTGNTHPRISNDDVKNLYIPIPDILLQQQIIKVIRNRRTEARKLKIEAEKEWQKAKKQFEKELLGV